MFNTEQAIATETQRHADAFAECETLHDFAAAISGGDLSKPGAGRLLAHYAQQEYCNRYYRTLKRHGYVAQALMLPEASTIREIFDSVDLIPYMTGARTRSEYINRYAGRVFISASRSPEFSFFGPLGATYGYRTCQYGRGQVRQQRGGQNWLTAGKPTSAVLSAWGDAIGGKVNDGEFGLGAFYAIKRPDGNFLLIAKDGQGICQRYLTILPPDQTPMSMLSEHERGEIEAEKAARITAFGEDY